MIDQLEIDRTQNTAVHCWKESGISALIQSQPAAKIILDSGNIIIIHVPGYESENRSSYRKPCYQLWMIDQWHMHSNDFDVYYDVDLYDEHIGDNPEEHWKSTIEEHKDTLINVFQDFRPPRYLGESNIIDTHDPRRAEIEARANPRYY